MKNLLLFFFLTFYINCLAQVTNKGEPISWTLSTKTSIEAINLPQIDIKKIRAEDISHKKLITKPFRIGIPQKANYGFENAGVWTQLPNGDRIWRILFSSKDAIHLSVNFNQFYLPKGSNIYLYNDDRTDLLGAYTEVQNNAKQVLGTWLVNGDKLWIEYYEPKEVTGQGKLNIATVIHGYRLGHSYQKGYKDGVLQPMNNSGDCNHDVDCPIGADFESHRDLLKKSVGFLNMANGMVCSGALVNNTAQDRKPYFLTSEHCYFDASDIPSDPSLYSVRFNWISPNPICGSSTNSTDAVNNEVMNGAYLKARNASSDFMLIELFNDIPSSWDVTYAGWDKTDAYPTFEVSIHHPSGDIMKISRDDDGATRLVNSGVYMWAIGGIGYGTGNGWELGVTEGGSSGGPLFDQNGRIIGQLRGGNAACDETDPTVDNNRYDLYGRFAAAWDLGTSQTTRLKEWLDPGSTNEDNIDVLDNVLAINDAFLEENISIFPNPTSGVIQIKVSPLISNLKYEIYNVLGQVVIYDQLQNNEIINLVNLPNDIYFIKFTEAATNNSFVKKIVLNK